MFTTSNRPPVGSLPQFVLGEIQATPGAFAMLQPLDFFLYLCRHIVGDWGEVDTDRREANTRALTAGGSIISVYRTSAGSKFLVTTEPDLFTHSGFATKFFLAEEVHCFPVN